jgi:hypothetical protein
MNSAFTDFENYSIFANPFPFTERKTIEQKIQPINKHNPVHGWRA